MKSTEGRIGRVFVLRLEDGDVMPTCLERFAEEKSIKAGHVILIGGIGGGEVVSGPRDSEARVPDPMLLPVDGAHEVVGLGILTPGDDGKPRERKALLPNVVGGPRDTLAVDESAHHALIAPSASQWERLAPIAGRPSPGE